MAPHLGIGTVQNFGKCVESVSLCVGAVLTDTGPLNLPSGASVSDTALGESCLAVAGKTLEVCACVAGCNLLGGRLGSKS